MLSADSLLSGIAIGLWKVLEISTLVGAWSRRDGSCVAS